MLAVAVQSELRVRAKITSQNWRSDSSQIRSIRLSKTGGMAGYIEDFGNEDRPKPVLAPDRGIA